MMWFDRDHPDVVFGDRRSEVVGVTDRSHGDKDGTRAVYISPDVRHDFRAMPYRDGGFKLVVFDPPHLDRCGARSWMAAKYGKLSGNWRDDLRRGFAECFRVLEAGGVLVFKWSETQIRLGEVLKLAVERPLFGHRTGHKGLTHWLVFMKSGMEGVELGQTGGLMAKLRSKIFVVSDQSGKHLVRALTVPGAIAHVVRSTIEGRLATQDDLVSLAVDHPVEDAMAVEAPRVPFSRSEKAAA